MVGGVGRRGGVARCFLGAELPVGRRRQDSGFGVALARTRILTWPDWRIVEKCPDTVARHTPARRRMERNAWHACIVAVGWSKATGIAPRYRYIRPLLATCRDIRGRRGCTIARRV